MLNETLGLFGKKKFTKRQVNNFKVDYIFCESTLNNLNNSILPESLSLSNAIGRDFPCQKTS